MLALLLIACQTPLTCGPGTVEVDGQCVPAPSDADADTDTDTDADADADADADTDADCDTDADADTDTDISDTGGWLCTFQSNLGNSTSVCGNTCAAWPGDHSPLVEPISCAPTGRMVVHEWTAPSAGLWRFSTAGSAFDTVLEVGAPCSTVLGCADDRGLLPTPQVSDLQIDLAAGEVVHIKIAGYAGVCGDYTLSISPGSSPPTGASPPPLPQGAWAGTTGGGLEEAVLSATIAGTSPPFLGTATAASGSYTLTGELTPGGLKGESSAHGPFTCRYDGVALACGFYIPGGTWTDPLDATYTLVPVP